MTYFGKNSNLIWQWNGTDLSQFDSPILFGGATSVTASVISEPYGTGAKVIRLGFPSGTIAGGGALIPIKITAPFQSMNIRMFTSTDTGSIGFGVTASNVLIGGLAFGADSTIGTCITMYHVIDPTSLVDTIGIAVGNGYTATGSVVLNLTGIPAPVRITEFGFNGQLLTITGSNYPSATGILKSVGYNVTNSLESAVLMNSYYPGFSSSWVSSTKNKIGIYISTPTNLTSGSSMIMSTISFEKFGRGYP
jgi:hypothetical protein